jgi:hypothetical protein
MEVKRTSQSSAVNRKRVLDGMTEIDECWRCSLFSRNKGTCLETGEFIKYSLGGPLGTLCTLPVVVNPDDKED